jgi:hypothetical protein
MKIAEELVINHVNQKQNIVVIDIVWPILRFLL